MMGQEQHDAAMHHLILHMQVEVQRRVIGLLLEALGGSYTVTEDAAADFDPARLDVKIDREAGTATYSVLPSFDSVVEGLVIELSEDGEA
jgi:hypothetical protein